MFEAKETGSQGWKKLIAVLYTNTCAPKEGIPGRLAEAAASELFILEQLFIETRLVVPAQHASSSTDFAGHVDTSRLLMHGPIAPRVLTAPLQLDSNLPVSLEGAVMVPLTCLTRALLCTHHWPAFHRKKRGAPNLGSRPHSIQAQHHGFT